MTNQRIVFKNVDGSCGIIVPAPEALQRMSIEDIAEKDVPPGLQFRITTTDKIPVDRTFRGAWTDDNPTDTVDVDMPKARILHMNSLRSLRDEKLKALDIEHIKAEEQGDATLKSNIATQKQELRDMPQTFDLSVATTPEELKAMIPDSLK